MTDLRPLDSLVHQPLSAFKLMTCLYVCACVCMYAPLVCLGELTMTCLHVSVCMCVCLFVCLFVCLDVCVCVCVCVCARAHVNLSV